MCHSGSSRLCGSCSFKHALFRALSNSLKIQINIVFLSQEGSCGLSGCGKKKKMLHSESEQHA